MKTKIGHTGAVKRVLYQAFLLGYISMATQIILLREFLLIYYGNDLVTGIIISLWLALTAVGARAGINRKIAVSPLRLLYLQGILLLLLPFATEFFRNIVFLPGTMLGPLQVILYSTSILSLFCLPNGFVFALLNREYNRRPQMGKKIYGWESIGGFFAGALTTLLSLPLFSLQNLTIALFLFWLYLVLLARITLRTKEKHKQMIFILLLLLLSLAFLFLLLPNHYLKRQLFFGEQVVASTDTPYGNITITQTKGQKNIYFNGSPMFSSENIEAREANVHYQLLQRSDAKTILLVGGGLQCAEQEILKYPGVQKVIHTELTTALFDTSFHHPKVQRIVTDAIGFLKKDTSRYDAVLLIIPPPDNAINNRFYTNDFFLMAKNHLTSGGIIGFALPASENFLDMEELHIHSILFNTLHHVFDNVLLVPGVKNHFLASDGKLSLQYDSLYVYAGIQNRYVNPDYIKLPELLFRHDLLMKQLLHHTGENSLYHPLICYISQKQWLNYFNIPFQWISGIATFLFLLFLLAAPADPVRMFGFGFAGASMEIVLLVAVQVIFGNLYFFTGIMITLFMAGLGTGALGKQACIKQSYWGLLFFGLISLLLLVILQSDLPQSLPYGTMALFLGILFLTGYLTGNQYKMLLAQKGKGSASLLYAFDLTGALLGGFIASVWLIPVYGIPTTLKALPLLLFLTLLVARLKEKFSIL